MLLTKNNNKQLTKKESLETQNVFNGSDKKIKD